MDKEKSLLTQLLDFTDSRYSQGVGAAAQQDILQVRLALLSLDDKYVLGTFVKSPYHLVYFDDNAEASDINHLLKGENIKVGVWDSAFWSAAQAKFFEDLNPNIKTIRYKSKPFRTALASGEIDYKLVSFPGENPVIAVLGENQYGAKTGEDLLPGHVFADMGYSYLVAGNIDFDYTIVFVIAMFLIYIYFNDRNNRPKH